MRNFYLLAAGLNTAPLLHQVFLHPELWNQNTVRTAHPGRPPPEVDDILLRFQASDGAAIIDDCECAWFPAWDVLSDAAQLVFDLARAVRAERIGRVLITRLAPGRTIAPHEDGGAVATYYTRYQMPLASEPGCVFECAGERLQMRPGEAWWFNNRLTHAVVNNSAADRIAMVVDLRTR